MSTLALNSDNDIYFNNAGRIVTIADKNSDAEILQRIKVRLRFFKGEWFLNTDHGMPYFDDTLDGNGGSGDNAILGSKNLDNNIIESIFRREILSVEGVKGLLESSVDYDPVERKVSYYFSVVSINNTTINDNLIL